MLRRDQPKRAVVSVELCPIWFMSRGLKNKRKEIFTHAVAVCAMHYTGMAAAEFICTAGNCNAIPQGFGYVSSFGISALVIIATASMMILIAISMLFDPATATSGQKLYADPFRV